MLLADASYCTYREEKPRYGLPRLPFCTVRTRPVDGFRRPSGSLMVAVLLTFNAFCASSSPEFFGLMFSCGIKSRVPFRPVYPISIVVLWSICQERVRFQF